MSTKLGEESQMKDKLLQMVAKVIYTSAVFGAGQPSSHGIYQMKVPKALQK